MRLVGIQVGVIRYPYLRTRLADSGDQNRPRLVADRLPLLHPRPVHALERLDGFNGMVGQTAEQYLRAVTPAYLVRQHLVMVAQTQQRYLILEHGVHRILDRLLHLAKAADAQRCQLPLYQQRPRKTPRLAGAPAPARHLVTVGLEQKRQLLRELRPNFHQAHWFADARTRSPPCSNARRPRPCR